MALPSAHTAHMHPWANTTLLLACGLLLCASEPLWTNAKRA